MTDEYRVEKYCPLLNSCKCHKYQANCKQKKKIRDQSGCCGYLPHYLRQTAIISVKQHHRKKNNAIGGHTCKITTRLELLTKLNDRWLNSHCVPILKAWKTKIYLRLTIDVVNISDYMDNYMTKS